MEFQNGKSIFLQIADSLAERILNNEFAPDSKIPSVREMASEVGVNPNTIMRTYSELQSMNIIENKRGIGYYVKADAKELIRQKKRDEFFNELLPGFLKQAKVLGITNEELKKYL